MAHKEDNKQFIKIDWGRQGGVIFAYVLALIGFYGIIANIVMQGGVGWRSYLQLTMLERTVIIWPYKTYVQTFFLPVLLLFSISFFLTYKEDIFHYGIRASLWLVPLIIVEGLIFYGIMFPDDIITALKYQFLNGEGYINIFILFAINLSGSLFGMQFKKHIISKRVIY
ncbi:MAG: hypothetical protein ACTSWY_10365 [Promethearchaeota archaeon]